MQARPEWSLGEEAANAALQYRMPQTLALPEADALSEGAQDALAWAHPVVQEWFTAKFGSPTEPQIAGWPAILRGEPTLISAPTGSGKTLAAFLVCTDQLLRAALAGDLAPQTQAFVVTRIAFQNVVYNARRAVEVVEVYGLAHLLDIVERQPRSDAVIARLSRQ